MLLWLVRDWLSILSLVREAHPPLLSPGRDSLSQKFVAGRSWWRFVTPCVASSLFEFIAYLTGLNSNPSGSSDPWVAARPSGSLAGVRELLVAGSATAASVSYCSFFFGVATSSLAPQYLLPFAVVDFFIRLKTNYHFFSSKKLDLRLSTDGKHLSTCLKLPEPRASGKPVVVDRWVSYVDRWVCPVDSQTRHVDRYCPGSRNLVLEAYIPGRDTSSRPHPPIGPRVASACAHLQSRLSALCCSPALAPRAPYSGVRMRLYQATQARARPRLPAHPPAMHPPPPVDARLPARCHAPPSLPVTSRAFRIHADRVPRSSWTIVEHAASLNYARKRRGVVQFAWELAEGSA
ncbi:hypothetical protein Taro_007259 [Colocasia esculenta]|uniref:Uncharacterized protein n=1 Tax=Colocasia esculenta TaxID=4460 RepID=A0A843TYF6_COLES|nr:hypothetical protein [Colocasia esculenta]